MNLEPHLTIKAPSTNSSRRVAHQISIISVELLQVVAELADINTQFLPTKMKELRGFLDLSRPILKRDHAEPQLIL